jgi:hypothetical protein
MCVTKSSEVGGVESKSKQQAEKKHGGRRPGAGRKPKYGTRTVVMRVPLNRVQEVQNLLARAQVESVTESKLLTDSMVLRERWGELLKSKSPRKQCVPSKK